MSDTFDFYGEASPIPKGCSIGYTKEDSIVKITINLEKVTPNQLMRAFFVVSTMTEESDN